MTQTMMVLGDFVFSLPTLVYQDLSRRNAWRFGENNRLGARAGQQFIGPGADDISLGGYLVPQVAGDAGSIKRLRALGDLGQPQALVGGDGEVFGAFIIVSLDERRSSLRGDGQAGRYDFQLELRAVDDTDALAASARASAEPAGQGGSGRRFLV